MQIVCIHIQIFMRTNPFYLLCEQYFISIYARRDAAIHVRTLALDAFSLFLSSSLSLSHFGSLFPYTKLYNFSDSFLFIIFFFFFPHFIVVFRFLGFGRRSSVWCNNGKNIYLIVVGFEKDNWKSMSGLTRVALLCDWSSNDVGDSAIKYIIHDSDGLNVILATMNKNSKDVNDTLPILCVFFNHFFKAIFLLLSRMQPSRKPLPKFISFYSLIFTIVSRRKNRFCCGKTCCDSARLAQCTFLVKK